MLFIILFCLGIPQVAGCPVFRDDDRVNVRVEGNHHPRVLINEIMFDPYPAQGLPGIEYIELFNADSITFNLLNWSLNEGLFPGYSLLPGEFLIVCKKNEETELAKFGNSTGISPWDVLNNEGQQVVLKDNSGEVIDQIDYSVDLIGDKEKKAGGWSIELINPLYPCKGVFNWTVSIHPLGGSPGQENSVYSIQPDQHSPFITGQGWISPDTLYLLFSEPVEITSDDPADLFTFNPPLDMLHIFDSDVAKFSYYLIFENRIKEGYPYLFSISGISDCAGNQIRDTILTTGIGVEPGFLDLLITELMVDEIPARALPESEYVEIYNTSDNIIDLEGILFLHGKDTIYLPQSSILPGEYRVFCPRTRLDLFSGISRPVGLSPFPRLLNNGQTLALFNKHQQLIFSLKYEKDWYRDLEKSEGGFALEMIDIENPCGDEGNWRASESHTGGTPGYSNSVAESNPDRTGPGIETVYASDPNAIEVFLTEKLDPASLHALNISIPGISDTWIQSLDSLFYKSFSLYLSNPLSDNKPYEIVLEGLRDCVGNLVNPDENHFHFYLPQKGEKGDLLINEIMFNPKPGGVDWVEIYNKSEKFIDLSNVAISTLSNGSPDYSVNITHTHQLIGPSGFLVITENKNTLIADFPSSRPEFIIEVEKMPALPDQFGNIALVTLENIILDHFSYQSDFHYKLITDDEGISLERISVTDSTNNPDNWHSASSLVGYATPTYANSSQVYTFSDPEKITVEPQVITPDADGFEDMLHIHYETSRPGYSANVDVLSIRGQLVRSILKNRLLSTKGTLTWDGYSDKGQIPPTGIYILRFEIYNLQGDYHRFKKRFVIAKKF